VENRIFPQWFSEDKLMSRTLDSQTDVLFSSPAWRWPLLSWLRQRWQGWRLRHQLPSNFVLHLAGIPLAVAGVGLLFLCPWYWGLGAFVLGYLLQYAGHRLEGNDLGEWAACKRLLGWPYVGIAPRWNPEDPRLLIRFSRGPRIKHGGLE